MKTPSGWATVLEITFTIGLVVGTIALMIYTAGAK